MGAELLTTGERLEMFPSTGSPRPVVDHAGRHSVRRRHLCCLPLDKCRTQPPREEMNDALEDKMAVPFSQCACAKLKALILETSCCAVTFPYRWTENGIRDEFKAKRNNNGRRADKEASLHAVCCVSVASPLVLFEEVFL